MAVKNMFVHLDFNAQEIQNVSLEKLATDPSSGDLYTGRTWYNTAESRVKYYDGSNVKSVTNLTDLDAIGNPIGSIDVTGAAVTDSVTIASLPANTPTAVGFTILTGGSAVISNVNITDSATEEIALKVVGIGTNALTVESNIALNNIVVAGTGSA